MKYTDSSIYIGEILNGLKNGFGVLFDNESYIYEGVWVDSVP